MKLVFVFHEGGPIASKSAIAQNPMSESMFLKMIREARNYRIGFVFADQVPQAQHEVVRANIGTTGLLRRARCGRGRLQDDDAPERSSGPRS